VSAPKNQLAIALHYESPGTPRVVAKGKGEIGQKIIDTARQHGVPIEENASLAGALSEVEIGNEIPLELYKAVAEVLIFLMRMSGVRPGKKAAAGQGQPQIRSPDGAKRNPGPASPRNSVRPPG
jgi:flagellar biosynthesis protein